MSNFQLAKQVIDKCADAELLNPEIAQSITKAEHVSSL